MKNKHITRKISQGVYVLTTQGGGCIVDAVSQISTGENPLIAVSVMKKNYTNKLLQEQDIFALSVLSTKVKPQIIEQFGFHSSRNIDKFKGIDTTEMAGVKIINDSLGYLICEVINKIDAQTHTLFIGRLIEADVFEGEEKEMTYNYYQKHKEEFVQVKTEDGGSAWVCQTCGYVYYGENLPEDFKCPVCGVDKEFFKKTEVKIMK